MIDAINELFSTGDRVNIELGIMQVEAQGLDFRLFPLLAGARSLAGQIGGGWQEYATPNLRLGYSNIAGALDLRAYGAALQELDCRDNELTALDVRDCTELRWLHCGFNQLTALDLRDCTELKKLDCGFNQLTALDVRCCTELRELDCGFNQLTALDLRDCTELRELSCYGNQLKTLDVRDCQELRYISAGNNPELAKIFVSPHTCVLAGPHTKIIRQ